MYFNVQGSNMCMSDALLDATNNWYGLWVTTELHLDPSIALTTEPELVLWNVQSFIEIKSRDNTKQRQIGDRWPVAVEGEHFETALVWTINDDFVQKPSRTWLSTVVADNDALNVIKIDSIHSEEIHLLHTTSISNITVCPCSVVDNIYSDSILDL